MLRNILPVILFFLFTFLAFHFESATKVKNIDNIEFSAESALEHLKEIAKEPHPIGSKANQEVRDYILDQFNALGLDVEVQKGYTRSSWKPSYMKMAYVENVIATLPGTDPNTKKVVISCHYDSVIEGPGAADDGYAVACAIETAKLLSKEKRKNDIIFLITDGEEYGLLGAQYFADHSDISQIGVMLNYEARGNEGPGIAFELSENNSWLIDQLSVSYTRPIANSLSFEVYKRMGNGSDFTIFKEKNIPGINHAFIDGFSYYHHPQDNLNYISKNSIQHTGENMYLAAKHFSNFEFKDIPKGNSSYFNFFGLFVNYSSDLDLTFLFLIVIFIVFLMLTLRKKEEYANKRVLIGAFALIGVLILSAGLCFGLSYLAKVIYPQYSTFYAYHYYNHEWYLIAGIGLTIVTAYYLGRFLLKKIGYLNLGIGLILLLTILSAALYTNAKSATYVMMYPLASISIGLFLKEKFKSDKKPWISQIIGTTTLLILIGFWAVFSHSLYLAFSLGILAVAIIPTALFCFASYSLLPRLWSNKILLTVGTSLAIAALIVAHFFSKPTEKKPLKSNLFYTYDSKSNKTYVATYNSYINEGHLGKLDQEKNITLDRHMPYARFANNSDISLDRYKSKSKIGAIDSIKKSQTIMLKHPYTATKINLIIPEISNIDSLFIDDQLNKAFKKNANGRFYSPLYGIGLDSIKIRITSRVSGIKSEVYVNTNYAEMPKNEELPKHIIRNGGKVVISQLLEFQTSIN